MARSRNIKPSIFVNEYLGTCDHMEFILFEGLWCLADRYGRLENRPLRIKAQIFPYRDYTAQVITGALQNLSSNGFITLYTVDGQDYIEVRNFEKHQNPHKNEKGGDIPPPPQPTENKEGKVTSSNYASAPENDGTAPEESCIRNEESCIEDSLQEGATSSDEPPTNPDLVRTFPTKDGSDCTVEESFVTELKKTYPQLDIEYQLRKARTWLIANRAKRKTAKGMTRFLNTWMSNASPPAQVHRLSGTHGGFDKRDYSEGLREVPHGQSNF